MAKTCSCDGDKCKMTAARRERIRREKCGGCRSDFYNWPREADSYGRWIPEGFHCFSMPDMDLRRRGQPSCWHR